MARCNGFWRQVETLVISGAKATCAFSQMVLGGIEIGDRAVLAELPYAVRLTKVTTR